MSVASTGEKSLETRTLRRVAVRALPFLMALYFVNYFDRTNLGIAKADISAHLQLTATMFGLASGIFFIGYVLVEVPSNLALERFGARRWLARIALSWGIVAVAIGFAPNAAALLVLRFLLGVAEAGLFPGVIFYLTRWFRRLPGPDRGDVHDGQPDRRGDRNSGGGVPSIITGFKQTFGVQLSILQVGLITAVPYTLAAIAMYLWSRHADRTREHVWHVAIPMGLGGLAIPIALYLHTPLLVMIPVCIAAMGVFSAIPSFWALPAQFLTGAAAAGGIGLINSIGNLGGFAAPYATGALNQFTGNDKAGMWAVGIFMIVSAVVVVALRATPERGK
jgi:MFS family permease